MALIEVRNLRKEFKVKKRKEGLMGAIQGLFTNDYEIKRAVNDISFSIEEGEIVGYIGPNGAGKSTTIKMLVGILVPTGGSIIVNGIIPHKNRIENAKNIGVVFGQRTQLWWDIPVYESFTMMKYLYKIPEKKFKKNLDMFTELLELDKFLNIPVRQLSLGQRMRSDLCAALLHEPDIIYLDEPTIGLDVVVKEKIRNFIKEINREKGTTVIITTHDMSDVEKLCSRIILIDQGQVMYDGSLEKIKHTYGSEEILQVEIDDYTIDLNILYELGISQVSCERNILNLKYDPRKINSAQILKVLMEYCKINDFSIKSVDTEEIIRKLYETQDYRKYAG